MQNDCTKNLYINILLKIFYFYIKNILLSTLFLHNGKAHYWAFIRTLQNIDFN